MLCKSMKLVYPIDNRTVRRGITDALSFLLSLIFKCSSLQSSCRDIMYDMKELAKEKKKELQEFALAEQRAAKLNDTNLVISALSSDEGKLYGSIGINEIKDALQEKKVEVSKREIVMPDGPLHSLGNYTVEIHVHSDIIAKLQIEVIADKKK